MNLQFSNWNSIFWFPFNLVFVRSFNYLFWLDVDENEASIVNVAMYTNTSLTEIAVAKWFIFTKIETPLISANLIFKEINLKKCVTVSDSVVNFVYVHLTSYNKYYKIITVASIHFDRGKKKHIVKNDVFIFFCCIFIRISEA